MLRIAVIGGGNHSRNNHLPALKAYTSHFPGEIELSAFCDMNPETAGAVGKEFGFLRIYTKAADMLSNEKLDGCIAVTPIPVTAAIARQVIEAGVPLLMEKPPGTNPSEARDICVVTTRIQAKVMVSMNRRFDPALHAALDWIADRPLRYLRATMHRNERTEEDFFTGTAIHALDAMRWIAGDVADYSIQIQRVGGVLWYAVRFTFSSGTWGLLDVIPTCGHLEESYELLGSGFRLASTAGDYGAGGFKAWENGKLVEEKEPAGRMPAWIRNGTYAETVEFLSALREGRSPHPTPAEVLQSVELCHQIQQEATV